MMKTKILVCVHKKDFFFENEIYMPIHVGKSLSTQNLGITGDNTGENISHKNKEFCELTAQYWAWKNLKEVDYIGLSHYRRYLDINNNSLKLMNIVGNENLSPPETNYNELFNKYDIILSNRYYYKVSNKTQYCYNHILEDYIILREVINELYPEYVKSFDKIMIKNNKMSVGNLFITKWNTFDAYSEWLFTILFETEKRVKLSPYDYQRRVFGFMAERLLDVYCFHQKLKIKRSPILFVGDIKQRSLFYYQFKNLKNTIKFKFSSQL